MADPYRTAKGLTPAERKALATAVQLPHDGNWYLRARVRMDVRRRLYAKGILGKSSVQKLIKLGRDVREIVLEEEAHG